MQHLKSDTFFSGRTLVSYIVKKGYRFSRPQPGCHQPNSPLPGIIKLFTASESLVSDIPAGDGKKYNLFYSVLVGLLSEADL